MASIAKLKSGSWRVEIRRKGQYAARTFRLRSDAQAWTREMEHRVDLGQSLNARYAARAKTVGDLISLHVADMCEVGRAPLRMMVSVWQPARGRIRLDGADLSQWAPAALGRHIGYLPQDVELFAGTVAENIARFEPEADPEAIIAAAKAAGVHDLIVGLPDGYETELSEQGKALSAGQRQRVALARALYGDPFLVVLDEPNSNLDSEGEKALTKAIHGVRSRGGIAIVVAHRKSALAGVDFVLTMAKGKAVAFGPKSEVLPKILRTVPQEVFSKKSLGERLAEAGANTP